MENETLRGLETVQSFIDSIDQRLGQMSDTEVENVLEQFTAETQPWLINLLAAIEDDHDVDPGYLAECLFQVYALHQFYTEVMGLTPETVAAAEIERIIIKIEKSLDKLISAHPDGDINPFDLPFLNQDIIKLFFIAWEEHLDELLEYGDLDEELYEDVWKFYLITLRAYGDQFPDARLSA